MPPFKRFQTDKLIMWTIGGAQKSSEKEDSFLKMDNRFGSIEAAELEIG